MMKKRLYVAFLFVFGLLISCHKDVSSDIFSKIEACMEMHPDSALMLLHQIPHPERLSGKQRADYALLLTQAQDKNFLDSLLSDSLIKIAVDYYRDSKDDVKAGKSYFYYGRVMAYQDNDTVAMQAYLDAQTRLEKTKEYKILGLIQECIGYLNDTRKQYDIALCNYRRSIEFYLNGGDTLGVVYNYRNIAWVFERKQNYDSISKYVEQGISFLKGDTIVPIWSSLLQLKGNLLRKKGDFPNAINCLLMAIKYEKNTSSVPFYYFSLGHVYMQTEYLDKAEKCYKQGLLSERVYTKGSAYKNLYLLEKHRRNYCKALLYKELSDSLFNIYKDEKSANNITVVHQKYDKRRLLMENELIKEKKQNQLYFGIIIFILLAIFCLIIYLETKKRYRKALKKRLREHTEKALKTIAANEQVIEEYSRQITELQQQDIQIKEETRVQIDLLNERILILQDENKEIREKKGGICILEELRKYKLIVAKMSKTEMSQLFEYTDLILNDFSTRLRKEYNLNENNLLFAILVRLNFSVDQLNFVFECESDSVYRRKSRLKKSLHLSEKDDLKAFLDSYCSAFVQMN